MPSWIDLPLVGLDTETTGLSVQDDRIFEIGLVTFQGGKITDSYGILIDPLRPQSRESAEKTGVSDADLRGKPPFTSIAGEVVERIQGRVLVGYNLLAFDLPMLDAELRRAGRELPPCWAVDVLIFARQLVKGGRHNLTEMVQKYGITMETAHRATADAEGVVRLLLAMTSELPRDLDDLIALQSQWKEEQRQKRATWRARPDEPVIRLDQLLGDQRGADRGGDGQVSLGPAYLFGQETDPLRAYLGAYATIGGRE